MGHAERTLVAVIDERQNFRNRRVAVSHWSHSGKPVGKDAATMEELLIEFTHKLKALMGELSPSHADHVQPFQMRELAARETVGNDVVP